MTERDRLVAAVEETDAAQHAAWEASLVTDEAARLADEQFEIARSRKRDALAALAVYDADHTEDK